MTPSVADEVEVKYELPEGVALPDLGTLSDGGRVVARPTLRLDATYYDTAALTLLGLGVTLRHRYGEDGEAGWTLKIPRSTGRGGYRRSELSWSGPPDEVPGEIARLVAGLTRGRPLSAVAGMRTVRRRSDLVDAGGRRLAEIADDEVTLDGLAHGRFRQIEVELDRADVELVPRIQQVMRAAGARRTADRPKLAEALGLPAGTGRPPELRSSATIGEVVSRVATRTIHELESRDLALRLGDDPEVLHQARVACRRARADLGTLHPLLDPSWVRDTRAELRWLGTLLGEARDADVLASRLARRAEEARASDRAGYDALARRLAAQRDVAYGRVRAGLAEDRYVELLQRLEGAAASPPWRVDRLGAWVCAPNGSARPWLKKLVRHQWRRLEGQVKALPKQPTDPELHQVRIRAKRLRYGSELAAPVAGGAARRLAKRVVQLQDDLGAHQDAVAAEAWLRGVLADNRRPAGGAEAFVAGQLVTVERAVQAETRGTWPKAWRAVRSMAARRWPS